MNGTESSSRFVTWNSWSSWSSPVGLGIFFLTTALAVAIGLYALLNLIGTGIQLFSPPQQMMYSPQELQQLEAQQGTTSGTPAQ
jgi:hypothetical protein